MYFCHQLKANQLLTQSQYFKVVFDIDPIQKGHLLLISKDHYTSLTQLPKEVRYDLI
ncbi:TPA: HIT domain-containing protein, partial [Streptococcus pyogenes]|nr:HIT domain-containing protein [Streptococcus pyogenes]